MDYETVELKLSKFVYDDLQGIANSAGVSVDEVIKVIIALYIYTSGDKE